MTRRALLVGIDVYDSFPRLGGCANDVDAIQPLFERHEDETLNFTCRTHHDLSSDQLRRHLRALLDPGADIALFYFAGHGLGEMADVWLCTRDGTSTAPGVRFSEVLGWIQASKVAEIIVFLDCCFGGIGGEVPQLGDDGAHLRSGVSILAASRGDQAAFEQGGRGLFSSHLEDGLRGGAADVLGKVTIVSVYAYLTELFGPFDQRPTFKANVDRLHTLRGCKPAVPLKTLRQLHDLFPTDTYDLPLDPSYEPDAEPHHPEHEAAFAVLQRCRAAKLVEPVGEDHLYFAAIHSRSCVLTPLGRHYWRMDHLGLF